MKHTNWERLRILSVFLDSASLSETARRLAISQPTVSRQMRILESELGEALIDVTPEGAVPTAAALRLAPRLADMTRLAQDIEAIPHETPEIQTVRVSCGPWFAMLLSRNLGEILGEPADLRIALEPSTAFADLPRRQADLAVRNRRPERGRLVMRRLPDYSCAVYGARTLVEGRPEAFDERRYTFFDWAALAPELGHLPTARWLESRLKTTPVLWCATSTNLLDAVRGGRALAVMPCFAAEAYTALCRLSEAFVPDYDGHWIVMADDIRQRPHIRRAADRIVQMLNRMRDELTPPDADVPQASWRQES